jgi:putative ABC transport system permease protein
MSTLIQDLHYGLRMLAKAPVVSTVAALSLALGIAANASIFAILNAFLFEPLPFRDQDSLVLVREGRQGEPVEAFGGTSVGNFRDYEAGAASLDGLMIYTIEPANLTGLDAPEQVNLVLGTPNLLDVLGAEPSLGRGFRPEEGTEGVGRAVVLEHDFWKRRFLEDRDVLGRTITLNGGAYTIVGVMPETFDMIPANVDVLVPTDFAAERTDREARGYISFGRVAAGSSPAQVQRELESLWSRLEAEYPEANRGRQVVAVPARDFFPGPTDQKLVMILTVVTLFGLLIACANVANLLLGRAEERQKEVAVRTALGAPRNRILRQLLTESVTLGLVAGVAGTLLSVVVVRWLQGVMPPEMPRAMIPRLDPEVLAATLLVSLLAGVVFGLAPALHATRSDLRDALGEGSRGGTAGRSRRRMRNAFVVGEFAVALALLTGAGFLVEAFRALTGAEPGYQQEGLLTFSLTADEDRYPGPDELRAYDDALLAALADVPGVQGVAAMSSLPRGRANASVRYTVEGRPAVEDVELPSAGLQVVNPAYLGTMGIPVRQGRGVEPTDRGESAPVVVVSEAFVRREFPESDPLGQAIALDGEEEPRTIVGVVGDILQDRIQIAGDRGEALYVPLAQKPRRVLSFALRVPGDPAAVTGDVRRAVWSVNPDQPVAQVRTLDDFVGESLAGPRALSLFLAAMAVIALLLAALGIYGVIAHAVAQRQREIGIRMALGAARGSVVGMITMSGLTLAGVGMLLGLPLVFVMYRMAASALGVFEGDIGLAYAGGVALALAAVATLATWLPARRASGIHPSEALRDG